MWECASCVLLICTICTGIPWTDTWTTLLNAVVRRSDSKLLRCWLDSMLWVFFACVDDFWLSESRVTTYTLAVFERLYILQSFASHFTYHFVLKYLTNRFYVLRGFRLWRFEMSVTLCNNEKFFHVLPDMGNLNNRNWRKFDIESKMHLLASFSLQ